MAQDPLSWMRELLKQNMHESACLLGGFLLSSSGPGSSSSWTADPSPEARMLYGDALVGRGEQRRALHAYSEALQASRLSKPGSRGGGRSASPPSDLECEIQLRIAHCHVRLKEEPQATSILVSIPLRSRTTAAHLLLAKLHVRKGLVHDAIECYSAVLRSSPIAIEAAVGLADIGVSVRDILSVQPSLSQQPWFVQLIHAHAAAAAHEHEQAREAFGQLAAQFGRNSHVLLHCARASLLLLREDEALRLFERVRATDPACADCMDRYAQALAARGRVADLNRVCRDLLACDKSRPETWTAMACFWTAKGENARALEYAEKALALDPLHLAALQLKGRMELALSRPEQAVYAFRRANGTQPDIESFVGLLDAYLQVKWPCDLLSVAREATTAMPNCSRAHVLVANVHARSPDTRDKAKRVRARGAIAPIAQRLAWLGWTPD
jgi:anaphase-promoting complex subunit 7